MQECIGPITRAILPVPISTTTTMEGQKMEQFNRFLVQFISKDLDGTESVEVQEFEIEGPMTGEEIARWALKQTDNPTVYMTRVYVEGGRRIGEARI